jgi:photosystem II stability/assembly factor-like uncharacterized protein
MSGCAAKKPIPAAPPARVPTSLRSNWAKIAPPFRAANITAVGNVFWVCGDNEMIASSSDGGTSWNLRHQNASGATLLDIGFITEKVGHATGTNGRLLSTTDGGKTWTAHNAADTVWAFSFFDADNGIAVIGGDSNRDPRLWGQPAIMDGSVKLTQDGGDHWEDIAALGSEELRPFTQVLTVAALDASNYLMIRRQPGIEDVFLVTHDAGKSWHVVHQRNDATNRELARWVFVHGGEYWAFGMELVIAIRAAAMVYRSRYIRKMARRGCTEQAGRRSLEVVTARVAICGTVPWNLSMENTNSTGLCRRMAR